jgi:hypothetical protein
VSWQTPTSAYTKLAGPLSFNPLPVVDAAGTIAYYPNNQGAMAVLHRGQTTSNTSLEADPPNDAGPGVISAVAGGTFYGGVEGGVGGYQPDDASGVVSAQPLPIWLDVLAADPAGDLIVNADEDGRPPNVLWSAPQGGADLPAQFLEYGTYYSPGFVVENNGGAVYVAAADHLPHELTCS